MKKIRFLLMIFWASAALPEIAAAQSIAQDLEQLSLDYQKLAGLKSILSQMYKGYQIVSTGYNSVKGVAQGNYSLHQAFLDGLMIVSPTVRKYPRVADIINDQAMLVSEYKSSYGSFRRDKHFKPDEISYMTDVYNNLISQSLQNLNDLTMVMADNKLRMSDNERLQAIDRMYATGHEQLVFLRQFNERTQSIGIARAREVNDKQTLQKLYGIN